MTEHAVVIAGGGPTGLMLAGELALAGIDVVIVERRVNQEVDGSRAGGLLSRTIEVLDQRGIAERFLLAGHVGPVQMFSGIVLNISDFPTRHNYVLALWQSKFEPILADWVSELGVPILRGCEVVGFSRDDTGVDVELSDSTLLRAKYLVGCDGGRSLIRKKAGIDFSGLDPSTSWMRSRSSASVVTASALTYSVEERTGSRFGSYLPKDTSNTPATPAWASFAKRSLPCTGPTSGFAVPLGSPGSLT